jgi:hypothetical protein
MDYYHATQENVHTGVNLGDMFNGLASFCCLKKKLNNLEPFYFVTHPSRFFLVNLFEKYGAKPISIDQCSDKPIKSVWINATGFSHYAKQVYNRDLIYWDYFERFGLTSEDLIDFYQTLIPNEIKNTSITNRDLIICPMTNGGIIIDNNLFIDYANKLKDQGLIDNIYVNVEGDVEYRKQNLNNFTNLQTTLEQFLSIAYYNKPNILGLRSGLFDILYGLNIHQPIHVFCNSKCGCQMGWRYSLAGERYKKMLEWKSNIIETVI